ncbi:MAG: tetraacyldisaccharide 4'-kinase [Candidatus Omnitrophota bacterium]
MYKFLYSLATDENNSIIARFVKIFLLIFSFFYGLIIRFLVFIYRQKQKKLDCRTISVGNITLGGTGKTVLVEYIARFLKQQGYNVAVLSRGYKKRGGMGDEPYMLKTNLKDIPVVVNKNRIRAAKSAMRDYKTDAVILDDGFQQWHIKKDLEIVVIDSTNLFGNKHMLPRGILREPLTSLKRADVFMLTKTNLNPNTYEVKDFLCRINYNALIVESIHKPQILYLLNKKSEILNNYILRGKSVAVFSAIGDPDSFEALVVSLGARICLTFKFSDHYNYAQKDLDNIIKASQQKKIDTIITTEKDAARIYESKVKIDGLQILVLRIELKITKNEEEFNNRLLSLYSR